MNYNNYARECREALYFIHTVVKLVGFNRDLAAFATIDVRYYHWYYYYNSNSVTNQLARIT